MRDAPEDDECLPRHRPGAEGVSKARPASHLAHAHKIELRIPVAVVARWAYQQFIEADQEHAEDRTQQKAGTQCPGDD